MCVLSKEIYSQIEWYFYNYPRIKKGLENYRNEVAAARPVEIGEWGGGRSCHSDPTALKAMKLTTIEIQEKEAWIRVIEKTCQNYAGTEKGRFIGLQYFQTLKRREICEGLYIERRTYYSWKNDIIYYAALLAQKYDLIDIEKSAAQN